MTHGPYWHSSTPQQSHLWYLSSSGRHCLFPAKDSSQVLPIAFAGFSRKHPRSGRCLMNRMRNMSSRSTPFHWPSLSYCWAAVFFCLLLSFRLSSIKITWDLNISAHEKPQHIPNDHDGYMLGFFYVSIQNSNGLQDIRWWLRLPSLYDMEITIYDIIQHPIL